MFSGHFGVGFGVKRAVPAIPLGTLILSAQLLDLVWPICLLLGLEHVRVDPGNTRMTPFDFYDYPITHSLVGALGWAIGFGLVQLWRRRSGLAAVVLGAGVLSHWVLDFVTHRPDLPLWPGGPRVGLGLWNHPAAELALEGAIYVVGVAFYLRATEARDRLGRWLLVGLIAILPLLQLAAALSPPPPSTMAIGIGGLIGWLFVLWGYVIARHRRAVVTVS